MNRSRIFFSVSPFKGTWESNP